MYSEIDTKIKIIFLRSKVYTMLTNKNSLLASVILFFLFTSNAYAGLMGDTINARWQYLPSFDQNFDYVVGPGIEGSPWVNANLDVSDSGIDIDFESQFIGQGEGTVWTFSSLDFGGAIIDSVVASTNWVNWSDSFISFGTDFIQIDFLNDVDWDGANNFFSLDIRTSSTSVPEPSSLVLLTLGIFGLIFRKKLT